MIDKNNILQGYKNSVVGIIPEEWDVKTFSELGSTLSTNTLSRDMMNEESGYALNIHYGDVLVKYGEILNCSKINIPWINYEYAENNLGAQLKDGDVVISDTAEDYSVGKVTELQGISNAKVFSGLHTIAYRPNKNIFSQRFLGYYFNSSIYRKQLYPLIQGIKVCSISKSAISKTKLAIPPLAEQKKIAEILCTWDDAIEKQSKLIEKLEFRKRGLMQRLLTGKTRLPGFTEPWKKIKLGEIGSTYTGLSGKTKSDFENGNAKFISYVNVFSNEKVNINDFGTVKVNSNEKQNIVRYGDIFFTVSSETPNEVGMSSVLLDAVENTYLNSFCFGYRLNDFSVLEPVFASYILRTDKFRSSIILLAQGSTRFNLSKNEVMKLQIKLPLLAEQKAIASVLSAADKEIEIQRKKLEALRHQKRGLMQQLLTGKIRVII